MKALDSERHHVLEFSQKVFGVDGTEGRSRRKYRPVPLASYRTPHASPCQSESLECEEACLPLSTLGVVRCVLVLLQVRHNPRFDGGR